MSHVIRNNKEDGVRRSINKGREGGDAASVSVHLGSAAC